MQYTKNAIVLTRLRDHKNSKINLSRLEIKYYVLLIIGRIWLDVLGILDSDWWPKFFMVTAKHFYYVSPDPVGLGWG